MQALLQSINQLASGFSHVNAEVRNFKELRSINEEDRFIQVMEVIGPLFQKSSDGSNPFQPFTQQFEPSIEALTNMGATLEKELKSLLSYYGEDPGSAEVPKPEDFFNLVASFSFSLQVCPLLQTSNAAMITFS